MMDTMMKEAEEGTAFVPVLTVMVDYGNAPFLRKSVRWVGMGCVLSDVGGPLARLCRLVDCI